MCRITMKYSVFMCVLLAILACASAQVTRYDNYKVFRMIPRTDEQLALLREFEKSAIQYDIWKGPSNKNVPVDVMVPPHKFAEFVEVVAKINIEAIPYIDNVQKLVDESSPKAKTNRALDWTAYYRGDEINAWLDELAASYPDKVTVVVIGQSYEGREIKGVKVSFKEGNKGVFIEAGIHAREWIAPATATYVLNELLTSTDPTVREVAESSDWYVFPVANPDGYEYSHTHERFWKKTRQPHGLLCKGADPNRNWGYHWMDGGASSLPCSETYAGPSPFSEVETKALSNYITSIQKKFFAYISFHSYSQLLLIPYGHSADHLENYEELNTIGVKAASSLAQRYGTKYTVGNIVDVSYVASGGSMDWVKGTYQTPITYTYELRDTGRYGFALPADQIIPTGEETMDSFITIMQEAKARGYY